MKILVGRVFLMIVTSVVMHVMYAPDWAAWAVGLLVSYQALPNRPVE